MTQHRLGGRGTWLFAGALMAAAGLVFLLGSDSPAALGWSLIAIGAAFAALSTRSTNR